MMNTPVERWNSDLSRGSKYAIFRDVFAGWKRTVLGEIIIKVSGRISGIKREVGKGLSGVPVRLGVIESIVKFDKGGKRVTRKGWISGVVVMVVVW